MFTAGNYRFGDESGACNANHSASDSEICQ